MKKIKITPEEKKLRSIQSVVEAEEEVFDKLWYNRCSFCHIRKWKPEYAKQYGWTKSMWKVAVYNAKRIEKKYGKNNLGSDDDFYLGRLDGRLETLNWVLGSDWEDLDT